MPYNGAHGEEQLKWLETELHNAMTEKQRVVVLTHVGVCPGVCDDDCLSWDYPQVLKLLHGAGKAVVAAVLSGHDHKVRWGFLSLDLLVDRLILRLRCSN